MRHARPIIAFFALVAAFNVSGDAFRVESRNAVPQITRDGQPVPARMLYVSKTPQEIAEIGPEWNDFELEFSILRSCREAAVHLRFFDLANRREPESIWFSKIELYDQSAKKTVKVFRFDGPLDGDITYWCTGRNAKPPIELANAAVPGIAGGALRISSQGDPNGKLGQFHVILRNLTVEKEHDYTLRCRARAERRQVLTSSVYHQTATPQPLAYPGKAVRSQVRLAMESGVDFVTFPLDNLWIEPGAEPDYSSIGRIYRTILAVNPNAKLIPRVDLRVPPAWWAERYPGEMMKFAAGGNLGYPSIASEQYRRDAAAALRGLIRYSETNFGSHMAGYHPSGGNTHEWFYLRSQGRIVSGYDDATRRTWREFLRRKYGSDGALRKAWNSGRVTLDSAEVPLPAERQAVRPVALLEPAADAPLIDFHLYLQEAMTDTILSLARVIREETGRNRLSVAFYGYLFEHAGIANGPAVSGHYALRRLLDCADIDIISGPISYHDRQLGGVSTTMTAADSITLAGKLWLNEDDTSTHTAYRNGNRSPGWKTGATTPDQSIALLRRNLAVAAMHNFGIWWMDLFGAGWFDDPQLWEEMKRFTPVFREFVESPRPYLPEIAEIVDERSMCFIGANELQRNHNAVTGPLVKLGRGARARIGAPVGQYLLDDLSAGKLKTRLNIILAACALDAKQRAALRKSAEKTPTLWCWAPGYIDLDTGKGSIEAVRETTGFEVIERTGVSFAVKPTPEGIAFGLSAAGTRTKDSARPTLSPVPRPGDRVLAEYGDGTAAIVLRPEPVPALFCGTTAVPPELYRAFAKYAGLHLYTDRPAGVLVNGDRLAVIAPEDGVYVVDTGGSGPVTDLLSGRELGNGPKVKLDLKQGDVALLRYR